MASPARHPSASLQNEAHELATRLPALMLEARRVSSALAQGLHGRRRAGPGETFWQFRPFTSGEPASRIDWRRSAREDRYFVREREWEAAHSIHLWVDRSASMGFRSSLALVTKIDRAFVLAFALADTLIEAGEQAGLLGLMPPRASRRIMAHFSERWLEEETPSDWIEAPPLKTQDEAILFSDCLEPPSRIETSLRHLAGQGARGHVVMILDPAEETFPFTGQAILHEEEGDMSLKIGEARLLAPLVQERIAHHRAALETLTRNLNWTLTLHRTDRPASEAALQILTRLALPKH